MALRALILLTLAVFWPMTAPAQQEIDVRPGGFLVLDQEAIFARSAFGRRILAETDAATRALVAENRSIEAQLVAEEKELTDRRPTLTAEAFRQVADEFDAKVQRIRDEQAQKSDAIGATLDRHRREFLQAIVPVLTDILRETRAVAILDKRSILISASLIDATDLAVARIDEKLGDGRAAQEAVESQPSGDGAGTDGPADGGGLLTPGPSGEQPSGN